MNSQDKVEWHDKPVIDRQGVLTFAGQTKSFATIGSRSNIAPFNLNNRKDTEGIWDPKLTALGAIQGYDLSADGTTFSARYQVPTELLDRERYELVVIVWGADPDNALGTCWVQYES